MSDAPELFSRPVKARSLAFLFIAGALVGCLTLIFPHPDAVMDTQLWVLAAVAVAIGGAGLWKAERLTEPLLHVMVASGTVILTLANYWVGPTSLYPLIYSWTILFAFYFFPLRLALAHLALAGVMYVGLLSIQDAASPVVRWVLAMGTPTVAGLLISRLLERVRGQATRAVEHARVLRESESRTRMIVDSAPDAFVAIDSDGAVVRWNAAAVRMFGWRAEEVLGRPLGELIYADVQREAFEERRREVLDADGEAAPMRAEVEPLRRDGTSFPAEITMTRLEADEGTMLTAFYRDLTEQKRREEEREEFYREQVARQEAEQMAATVHGLQVLLDVALVHSRMDAMLEALLPSLCEVLVAQAATVLMTEEGESGPELVVRASTAPIPPDPPRLRMGEGFGGGIAASREPLIVQDPRSEDLIDPAFRQGSYDSLLGVPLLSGGEVMGVIQVAAAAPRRFTNEDMALLVLAADRVAIALEHARVFERKHQMAEALQRSLLPGDLPQPPGLQVAATYQPARQEEEVGGDWYDVIQIAGGGVGLVMGDVAGKGLLAASMVGQLRSALRAYALERHEPAEVVERLNRLVWTELEESQMATLLYLLFDPEGEVRWVNAGHPPPLLVVGDGLAHFLEGPRSVPLGVMPFPSFEENSVTLEPGATILLYTDGLIERPGEHLDDGLAGLAEVVRNGPSDPQELCRHVLQAMVPEGGADDDVAILALRHSPMEEHIRLELRAAPEELAPMRGLLRRWLVHFHGSPSEIADITTAVGEACANAIEHAGASVRAPFEVAGTLRGREVDITVRDYGSWRPERPDDQGRGLTLMNALMDAVEVTPSPEGTTVRMTKVLNGSDRA